MLVLMVFIASQTLVSIDLWSSLFIVLVVVVLHNNPVSGEVFTRAQLIWVNLTLVLWRWETLNLPVRKYRFISSVIFGYNYGLQVRSQLVYINILLCLYNITTSILNLGESQWRPFTILLGLEQVTVVLTILYIVWNIQMTDLISLNNVKLVNGLWLFGSLLK